MAKFTPIQWCDSTVNPVMGCDGCELWDPHRGTDLCYAGHEHGRFKKKAEDSAEPQRRKLKGNTGYAAEFLKPELFPWRTEEAAQWPPLDGLVRRRGYDGMKKDKPWLDGLPRLIFVSDMGDALSRSVSFEYLRSEIIDVATSPAGRRHVWQWLTKRPGRMAQFAAFLAQDGRPWPSNVWVGTSVSSRASLGRAADLATVGDSNTIRFLSVEPQFEAIDLSGRLDGIRWVIQGGASATEDHPFAVEWAESLHEQCRRNQVVYFLKQLGRHATRGGERLPLKDSHGGNWNEWPAELRVREFPIPPRDVFAAQPDTRLSLPTVD
jgi:protein gp37